MTMGSITSTLLSGARRPEGPVQRYALRILPSWHFLAAGYSFRSKQQQPRHTIIIQQTDSGQTFPVFPPIA